MMITFIRTAQAIPGKAGDAIAWGKEIAAIVNRVTGKEMVVSVALGGLTSELAWIAQFDTAAQIEEALTKLMADSDYINALTKVHHLFVPGTGRDHFYKQV
jgi:hypothetical protein